ncbi:ubiquitin carboxyl-terminal hydrolase 25 [Trichonephila clavata]|uniref:ubiquitinyl hydrolase 1 n=1 Tax=Trichonephila clavata TaxID=2740835 RepID=A0A8X6J8D3_TRICU|nr:ubiquitin carboxyl-terminal hydrolase 25 [Trichonephila clavata]
MTVEQSPLERFSNQKQQQQPPILNVEKDAALSPTAGVIDLTNDGVEKEDDLKKAIALSLKEHEKVLGGQVTMEDQDISRVVEASLAESKAVGTKRKRGEVWQDPLNPHDRKRNGDWPVGLKNVGNTCWFSAVIQSLFHLPVFRKLVLNYSPDDWNEVGSNPKDGRNLVFMQELRKLFALMLCTKRKYVDPSHALEEFKEAFPDSSGTDSQQDVSEFTHKLLEWLEDAFKVNSCEQIPGDNGESMMEGPDQNPMLNLFYGHYLSEGQNEGRMFRNEETFGQYPLQVNGFSNIHESLEAAMAQEIESCNVMTKSGQESWFTRLPPIMLFELSRFQFNQQLGRPEKIHNKLEFPEIMFMDRYMEQNKATTRSIREQVRKLKEERDKLQKQLEKYLNYGSGPKKVPLCDALQYTLDFAESRKLIEENLSEDVEMASPASVSSLGGESPNSPNKVNCMEVTNSSIAVQLDGSSSSALSDLACTEQMNHISEDTVPSPQHISELELKVFQACLKRWRKEVESKVKNLQENINNIDNTIKEVYNDSSLQKKPYRLHAVLVHEGQAASGHYWAYVYCPNRTMWLKFNDVSVTEATWSELQRDSMGGHHYASAYCLLYVDELRPELFYEEGENEIGPEYLYTLPEDLQQYVEKDNVVFNLETEHWDFEQSRKKDSSTMTVGDGDCTIIGEKRMVLYDSTNASRFESSTSRENTVHRGDRHTLFTHYFTDTSHVENISPHESGNSGLFFNNLSMEHAAQVHQQTLARVEAFKVQIGQTVQQAFDELMCQEMTNLRRLSRMPSADDPRLQHVGIYIILNSTSPDIYLSWSVLEEFFISELDDFPKGRQVKESAMHKLEIFRRSLKEEHYATYRKWHQEYRTFRKVVALFVSGISNYHEAQHAVALDMFTHCCNLNSSLQKLPGARRGLDPKLLEHYRRSACLKLNEFVANQFEKSTDAKKALDTLLIAYEYILPSMEFLAARDASNSDVEVAEIIRNRWCSMLGLDLASAKQERLQDFLSKLLDPSNDLPKSRPAPPVHKRIFNLEEAYREALIIATKSGEYEAAQAAK